MKVPPSTTTREALIAELLKDVYALAGRIEEADKTIADRIAQATSNGANQALHTSRMNFESMIDERGRKLYSSGMKAAELIDDKLRSRVVKLTALNRALKRKGGMFLMLTAAFSIVGGAVGGAVAVRLLFGT